MGRGGDSNVAEETWTVYIHGKQLDVARFAKRHPGGTKVLHIMKNRDATEQFEAYHSDAAKRMLSGMLKSAPAGTAQFSRSAKTDAIVADFAELEKRAHEMGCFKIDFMHELGKATLVWGFVGVGAFLMRTYPTNTALVVLGMLLFVFGEYQAGWVDHDYAHHSIFESPFVNDIFASLGGGFLQGYDLGWWKAR
jgi:hypothetical protein